MNILIAGDFAPSARLAKQIEEKKYSEVFSENIRGIIKSADFSFVNFESPIVETDYKPIPKCGPNLRCTKEAAEAVRYAGFTGVTMANNHILDYGTEGLHKSVECCKDQGLDIVGVGEDLKDAEEILYIEKDGKTLAVINCCEHEFSIATETDAGANPLNPVRQFYAIQEAKKNADNVLVIVHGGHEMFQLPSPRMVETYRFFIDAGADIITIHYESEKHLDRTIAYIKAKGKKAAVALNPATPVHLLKNIITELDMVLIMSVNPGFGGQKFIEYTIDKVKEVKEMSIKYNKNLMIQVDGGIDSSNVQKVIDAGANVIVAGSAVFKNGAIEENIKALRGI